MRVQTHALLASIIASTIGHGFSQYTEQQQSGPPSPPTVPSPEGNENGSSASAICRNDPDWRFLNFDTVGCNDVMFLEPRRAYLCTLTDVHLNCPLTCGLCCEDDPEYSIAIGETDSVDCSWIGDDLEKQADWCETWNNGQMVRYGCPKSCGYCMSYISTTPSAAPVTMSPTTDPTPSPTGLPSPSPTDEPTTDPTSAPTDLPSTAPSSKPTSQPSQKPSLSPTALPSSSPTSSPSSIPSIQPSSSPTSGPSLSPSSSPSLSPTSLPTLIPSSSPSSLPSSKPTSPPTVSPSIGPTGKPSVDPSMSPSTKPTSDPSASPSRSPTASPTALPTKNPSPTPSDIPTDTPTQSIKPSASPTKTPTSSPTTKPTSSPTSSPTSTPTSSPTSAPTALPSTKPTSTPTSSPTSTPTSTPTSSPTSTPTSTPTSAPSSSPSSAPSSAPTMRKPNLVMMITDEHNFRTLSCYREYLLSKYRSKPGSVDVWGDVRIQTPNLDRLAKEGAMYTNFYTVAPLCTPSRGSFMSGLYPPFNGQTSLNHGAMGADIRTFAEILRDQRGYHTGYIGKWHLDGEKKPGWGSEYSGRDFGFNENTYRYNRGHWKYFDEVLPGKVKEYELSAEFKFQGKYNEHYATDFLVDRGIQFMNKAVEDGDPFAVVISVTDPHAPNENRPFYREMYQNSHFKVPETARNGMAFDPAAPGWNHFNVEEVPLNEVDSYLEEYENDKFFQDHLQQYFGMVKCIDMNIGRLMSTLEELGIDEETIFVFTSDHGDLLGEHGKLNKGRPYETSAGIPFLLRYPEKVKAGKLIETARSSVDFAPTILSLMGVKDSGVEFHGVDASEELLNDEAVSADNDEIILIMDTGKRPIWVAAMKNEYKLVIGKSDIPFLFDLRHDPDELINYIDSYYHRNIKTELQNFLSEAIAKFDAPIADSARYLYFDKPACWDDKSIVPRVNNLGFCSDIGTKISAKKCGQKMIRKHCPITCENCCQDSSGVLWARGQLKTCSQLGGECSDKKVRTFCPNTCGQC